MLELLQTLFDAYSTTTVSLDGGGQPPLPR